MPLINIKTSLKEVPNSNELLEKASRKLAELTGKPEQYVMTLLETNIPMKFGTKFEDSCFIEIKSIGNLNPKKISSEICELIKSTINISPDRIYINFEDIKASNWGFNKETFG